MYIVRNGRRYHKASTFDIIDLDFLNDDGVQSRLKQEHCLKVIPQVSGWEGATHNKRTGNIDRF